MPITQHTSQTVSAKFVGRAGALDSWTTKAVMVSTSSATAPLSICCATTFAVSITTEPM